MGDISFWKSELVTEMREMDSEIENLSVGGDVVECMVAHLNWLHFTLIHNTLNKILKPWHNENSS